MKTSIAAGISLLLTGAVCLAHDTWLSPSSYSAKPGEQIMFDLTSGMKFPELETGPKPERVERSGYRVGSETGELKKGTSGEKSLQIEQAFGSAGVATVWVQTLPRDIELTDDDVVHYMEEIHASEELQRAWAERKGKEKFKEIYTKCAKTFLTVGEATAADDSWKQPVGLSLELVPLQNPTTIRAGEAAKFKLLRNGEPLRDAAVVLQNGGAKPSSRKTDSDGVVAVEVPKSGPAMLTHVHLMPPREGKPWQSEFTTATFEVKAK